jgi:hypothetical protein
MSVDLAAMYLAGQSIPQIAARTGINRSRVRSELLKAGVTLRSRTEGIRLRDDLGQHLKGVSREFTPEWKANISSARQKWADENAVGTSLKASGYVVVTRGPDKDRGEHVVIMEKRLGRHLLPDECVHHIDRDRSNNDPNNLALVTTSGHTRLHRFEDRLEGVERIKNVRFG